MHKFHKQIFLLSIIGIISAVNIQPAAAFEKTDTTNRVLLSPAALSINADKSYSRPLFYGERQKRLDKLTSKEWFKMTSVSVPLILSGIAVEWAKQPVNDLRNAYVPNFRHKYDDYLQYAPAVLMLGLKIGGVKSRSSWGRMITADAFSVAIMATLVNGIKYTAKSQRPNSGSHNSFPSGHTAASFASVTALYLVGEKKMWKAALVLAVLIALSRLYLYVHYPTDIIGGVVFGSLSGYLGYKIVEWIQKKKIK